MKKISLLFFLLPAFTFLHAQKVDLSLSLEEGKTYSQQSESKLSIVQSINGQELNINMSVQGNMSFLVKAVTKADYVIDMRYEALSMYMELPQGGAMEFSSDKVDQNDIMSTVLNGITKQPITIVLGRKGTISEVSDLDSLWRSVFSRFPNIPEEQVNQVKGQIQSAYGPDAIKGNIEMVTAIFPRERVRVGEEWQVNNSMQSVMPVDVHTRYKLVEVHPDYYLIHGASSLQTADTATIVDTNGMPMKYNMAGKISSEIKIDKQSGWIIEAHNIQDIEGEAQIQASPQMPMQMTIPMVMKNETVITGY